MFSGKSKECNNRMTLDSNDYSTVVGNYEIMKISGSVKLHIGDPWGKPDMHKGPRT